MQNTDNTKRVNRLSKEKSPYLKQHQHNPVDWYPWGEEAFTKAQREDKPIFLSVGYSTCQWCHIMEREAFSDPEIAELMNEVFVSIKVDREERPDIDNIYMAACQVISAGGGWPLSVILTPEGRPFFAGTYFGKESQRDNPGLKDIILRTQDIWSKFRNEIIAQADENTDQLNIIAYKAGDKGISKVAARKAFYELASHYDEVNGGFGNKQKFPIPHYFMYLLRYGLNNDVPEAIDMVTKTLRAMRYGGIWDHVGYGFHRYATDPEWQIPHFEKMLYDQALLSIAYMEAYQVTGDNLFKKTAQQILDYMTNNLLTEEGAFYSAEDTDFDIREDRFYTWKIEEIRELLIGNVDFFSDVFNIKEKGNYFDEFAGEMNGNNILYRLKTDKQIAQKFDLEEDEIEGKIDSILAILQERRKSRKALHKDTKILTDWNSLAVTAFSKAATVFGEEKYAKIANNTINFITSKLMKPDLTFYHRYAEGESGIEGMIDDYIFTALGLLEFYKYSNEKEYLQLAENIIEKFVELFEDTKDGGFFFTSSKAEILISRRKEIHDSSTPSGNSVLLDVLLRLYSYTRKESYREQAEKLINTFASAINNVPSAYTYFLSGLDKFNNDNIDLVFTGNGKIDDIIRGINSKFNPYINIHNLTNKDFKSELPDFIDNISDDSDKITCYVCIGSKCDETIIGKDEIISVLKDKYSVKL